MTDPVHYPARRLTTLPQKLMQRHESSPLVSHTHTVIRRDPSRCPCKAPLHNLTHLKSQSSQNADMRRTFFSVTCRFTRNQADLISRASSEESASAVPPRDTAAVPCSATLGTRDTAVQNQRQNAESLSAQPLKRTVFTSHSR